MFTFRVVKACDRMARAEDGAIFNGYGQAGITRIIAASPHDPIAIPKVAQLPQIVVQAQERLRLAGVGGPYALVLGTALDESVTAATHDGYPIAKRIARLLADGQVVHAPRWLAACYYLCAVVTTMSLSGRTCRLATRVTARKRSNSILRNHSRSGCWSQRRRFILMAEAVGTSMPCVSISPETTGLKIL